jgi:hypothetical protein
MVSGFKDSRGQVIKGILFSLLSNPGILDPSDPYCAEYQSEVSA